MKKSSYLLFVLSTTLIYGQVGINTQTPETTLEVVGKPNDISHYDGIIPPRITGNQLAAKTYSSAKQGAVVYATSHSFKFDRSGQKYYPKAAPYYFDGTLWQSFSKEIAPIEYYIVLTLDSNSTAGLNSNFGMVCASELLGKYQYISDRLKILCHWNQKFAED